MVMMVNYDDDVGDSGGGKGVAMIVGKNDDDFDFECWCLWP